MRSMVAIVSYSFSVGYVGLQLLINVIMLLGYYEASYTKALSLLYIVYFFTFVKKLGTSKDRSNRRRGLKPLTIVVLRSHLDFALRRRAA